MPADPAQPSRPKRRFIGTVVAHTEKTATVVIERSARHPKYRKSYTVRLKLLAHDPTNAVKVGETVTVVESRPISLRKRWLVVPRED